jgi:hypothetical protein
MTRVSSKFYIASSLKQQSAGRHGTPQSAGRHGTTRLAAANDKVYQLLAHGQWFSLGAPASSTTKTGRHDMAEILLKVALKHQKKN